MSIYYNVNPVAQTSSNTCWHASACMIWWHWQGVTGRQGPMNTLANKWSADLPIAISDFVDLAKKSGLKALSPKPAQYSSGYLELLLRNQGPLWCAGKWYGPGHIIVLTGVQGDRVFINDPDGGVKKSHSVGWFNTHLDNWAQGCLMYKDPFSY